MRKRTHFLMDDSKNGREDTVLRVTGREFQTRPRAYRKGNNERAETLQVLQTRKKLINQCDENLI